MMRWILMGLVIAHSCGGEELGGVIRQLGDGRFAERETAQQQLVEHGDRNVEGVLRRAVQEYATTQDPEVRERLREVMLALVDKHLFRRPQAFLGISMALFFVGRQAERGVAEPRIQVMNTLPETAAERAGLAAGDLIVGVDGRPLAKEAVTQAFSEYVRSKAPGDKIRLSLVRGGERQELEVELGAMPEAQQAELFSDERRDAFFKDWLAKQLQNQVDSRPKFDKAPRSR